MLLIKRLIGLDTVYFKFIKIKPIVNSGAPKRRFIERYLKDNILYNNDYIKEKDYDQ